MDSDGCFQTCISCFAIVKEIGIAIMCVVLHSILKYHFVNKVVVSNCHLLTGSLFGFAGMV